MKKFFLTVFVFASIAIFGTAAEAQRSSTRGRVCGDPTARCPRQDNFQPYDLAFDSGENFVIVRSRPFYGIVLRSAKLKDWGDCEKPVFKEAERLEVQELFPKNKVFTLNCYEPGTNYYTNIADQTGMLAVFAGHTLAEANAFLKKVKATGKFPDVVVRKMRVEINGT